MNIAVWHNLPSGGGKRALSYHLRGLTARGHRLESWCPPTADRSYLPPGEVVTEHVTPLRAPSFWRHPIWSHSLAAAWDVVARLRAMDRHARECADAISRGGFDLLLVHPCTFFRVPPIAKYVAIPTVLYLQEPFRHLYEALPRLPWSALSANGRSPWSISHAAAWIKDLIRVQSLRIQVREEQQNARAFDRILVNSLFSRESVLRAYGQDARVCYLGVDTDLFVHHRRPREEFLVGVGAFVPEKNIEFVLRSLALVNRPGLRLVWIGNHVGPAYLRELTSLAASLNVCFEPRQGVTDAELVALLNRAAIFVYAPRLEPFGLAPLEAGACGLPVVAVGEGGVRETVLDGVNGVLTEPDPAAMAAAIQRLLDDKVYARRLGETGLAFVTRRWSLDAAIERLEEHLTDVLRAKTAAA
jgi:glycosyltransferase involved in cell wall biosynthesis